MGIQINGQTDSISAIDGSLTFSTSSVQQVADINATGIITAASANFTGNVSIGGTLTYQDVTNIDSVGIVTARAGVHVTGGNVAVGHNNPGTNLDVLRTSNDTGGIIVRNTNNSQANARAQVEISGGDNADGRLKIECNGTEHTFRQDGNGNLQIHNASAERVRIESGGFVGLGTDNPYHELHIQGSSDTRVLITSGGTGDAVMMFENASGNTWGHGIDLTNNNYVIAYNSASDPSLTADGKVEITTDGMVGINMIPSTTGNSTYMLQMYNAGSQCFMSLGQGSGNGPLNGLVMGVSNAAHYITGRENRPMIFATNDTERLRIAADGSATFKYKVNIGDSHTGGEILSLGKSSGSSYMGFINGGTHVGFIGYADQLIVGGASDEFGIRSQDDLLFAAGGNTERLRIASDGQATFDKGAVGGANQVIARFQAESSRRLDVVWHDSGSLMGFDTPSNHAYTFKTGGTERLRINDTGPISANPNSGDGDDFAATALKRDYNAWVDIFYEGWISGNNGWGTFWAGNSGAAYRRVSSDSNPNEYVFIGAGSKRFTFDLDYGGHAYFDGTLSQNNYDYAEYFEWEDGNPSNEDRRGYSVFVNSNGKIEKATSETSTSDIIGVISGTAAIIGDAAVYDWQGRYEIDEWGTRRREQITQVSWTDIDGTKHSYADENDVPSGIVVPDDASRRIHHRYIESSTYDSSQAYVPRDQRREWGIVGLLGKVRVRNDSPKHPNWKYIKTIAGKDLWLIK